MPFGGRAVQLVLVARSVDEDLVVVRIVEGTGARENVVHLEVGGHDVRRSAKVFAAVWTVVGLFLAEFVAEEFITGDLVRRLPKRIGEVFAIGILVLGSLCYPSGDFVALVDGLSKVTGEFDADAPRQISCLVDEGRNIVA